MPASDRGVNKVTKNGRCAIINFEVNEGGYPALTLPTWQIIVGAYTDRITEKTACSPNALLTNDV